LNLCIEKGAGSKRSASFFQGQLSQISNQQTHLVYVSAADFTADKSVVPNTFGVLVIASKGIK